MKNYILLNKDTPLLLFFSRQNEFGESEFHIGRWLSQVRPIGFGHDLADEEGDDRLTAFLEHRKAPKHRQHIQALLERYGCEDLEGFLRVSHALSLNDTFWVREEGSGLCWSDVSLYRHEFDELVSLAAFDGAISDTELSSTSPEFGTDGCFAKCWVRETEGIYLYKCGSPQLEIEPLSEFLAYQVARVICPTAIPYELTVFRGKLASKCRLFTDECHGLVKASRLVGRRATVPELLARFESIGSGEAFRRMCVLDALILNPDRHFGNFGVLVDNDTLRIQRMAPVFDHNRSLFPELDEDQLSDPGRYLRRCRPRFGQDFVLTARQLLTDGVRADLRRLTDFAFVQPDGLRASPERLALLSAIVRTQAGRILGTQP